ncbi:MAG: GerMN domain-containing protein [Bacillota bacterium]
MDRGKKILMRSFTLGALLFLLLGFLTGCAPREAPTPPSPPATEEKDKELQPDGNWRAVSLYFADEQSDRLVKEERSLALEGREPAVAVLEELIEGPEYPAHGRTIPPDVKVRDVKIGGGVAAADFSEELRTSHWGGSTGEILTVYSIVNTLAELPGVERVQILIEGEVVDTLVGHLELLEPLSPDWGLVAPRAAP